jgi:GNAT superfamily N-acetyltransferase
VTTTVRANLRAVAPEESSAVVPLLAAALLADVRFDPMSHSPGALIVYARHVLRCAYRAGTVDTVLASDATTVIGVAVTMPYPCDPAARLLPASEQEGLPGLPGLDLPAGNLAELGHLERSRRPHREPYQVLEYLAVHPGASYEQVGSMLLRILRRRFDATGFGCYAEAGSVRARNLYRQYGFVCLDGPGVGSGRAFSARMWRDPDPRSRRGFGPQTHRRVAELFRDGHGQRTIAAEVGCSVSTVHQILCTLGLKKLVALPEDAVRRYQNGEITPDDIGAALGIPTRRVVQKLLAAGVDVPASYEEGVRKDIIRRYTKDRESIKGIAPVVRRSAYYVRKTLEDADIPRRGPGGIPKSSPRFASPAAAPRARH